MVSEAVLLGMQPLGWRVEMPGGEDEEHVAFYFLCFYYYVIVVQGISL
jgi:hypothetical protein